MRYKNTAGKFFGLVTKHACDGQTDGQTNRQNYDSQDRASIAASRGKNGQLTETFLNFSWIYTAFINFYSTFANEKH